MYAQLLSLFLLTGYNIAAPAPAPEVPGADGMCERPKVYVDSVVKLPKDGPHLVSGTRGDANVNGGTVGFTKTYTISTTYSVSAGLSLDRDFEKIATLGFGLDASFSVSKTTGSSIAVNVGCPPNKDSPYNITWGLVDYTYSWKVTGRKMFMQGYDPMMKGCIDGDIADDRKGGERPFTNIYPAKQAGAQDGSDIQIEFQCCTDSYGNPYAGSPVCPDAT